MIFLILATSFMTFVKPTYTNIPLNAFGTGTVIDVARFSDWIGNATPSVNVFVQPADSPNFVGDNSLDTSTFDRQDFFRWSQQMFLWILSPVPADGSYGSCKGLVMNSPAFYDFSNNRYIRHRCDITGISESRTFDIKSTQNGKHNLPLFIEKDTEKVYDVAPTPKSKNEYQLVKDEEGNTIEVGNIIVEKNTPTLYDRNGKKIKKFVLFLDKNLNIESTLQQFSIDNQIFNIAVPIPFNPIVITSNQEQQFSTGGLTKNVLMARNGSLVYYNVMVNDVFAVFSQMVNKLPRTLPSTSTFPTTLSELETIKNYAAANGISIINTGNRVLAMELKTSWVEAINLPNSNDYVKTTAIIPNYVQSSTNTWTRSGTKTTTLALVGMHVVGSALGHPEMIWSTFEHINNTPNAGFAYTTNGQSIGTGGNGSTDTNHTDFLFCEPTTSTNASVFNVSHITGSQNLSGVNGFAISPSNTRRNQPFGWGGVFNTGGTPNAFNPIDVMSIADSNAQLVAINTDSKNRLAPNDVRRKYFQVGSTWSSLFQLNQQAGTIRLSNSTMETYTQATNANIALPTGQGLNCFSCHDAGFTKIGRSLPVVPAPASLFLSHVFYGTIAP